LRALTTNIWANISFTSVYFIKRQRMDAWIHCWCLHFGQIYQSDFIVFPVYAWPSRKRTERRIDLIAIQLGQQEIYPLNFNHRLAGHQNRTTNIQTLLRNFAEDTRKREGEGGKNCVGFRNTRYEIKLRYLSAIEQKDTSVLVQNTT